ncbi:MAG: TetR/AcrR family transcriptional regulator [Actinomycetota bacterium]|nr:TetR/AcrR family transcriptional regulator [Actinomycetota bacterium]
MAEPVKPRRSYHSPRRQQQAAATRQAILEGAQRLFERRGYPATTMEQVAAEAGVALKTVYLAFTTKSGLLRALWDLRLKGDQSEAAVAERPWYREVVEEPDPERQLRGNARNARLVKERIAGVLKILRSAAPVDPDAEALWRLIQTDFYDNQRVIVESLEARQALRPGLDVARASDILWTLNHPDVWLLLVGERGWTPGQWERWFADTACAQLLRPR